MRWQEDKGECRLVICYHDNDDLHGTVHVRNFLLLDLKLREDGKT